VPKVEQFAAVSGKKALFYLVNQDACSSSRMMARRSVSS
jgi:hypothetical protein